MSASHLPLCHLACLSLALCSLPSIVRRIPKGSRGAKLSTLLEEVVSQNSVASWQRLLEFLSRCLGAPTCGGHSRSLVSFQIEDESDLQGCPPSSLRRSPRTTSDALHHLISLKLEEGDIRAAIRLACSEDSIAPSTEETYSALVAIHPQSHPHSSYLPAPSVSDYSSISRAPGLVAQAILSFPAGSAGGPDGLHPQHLKDLLHAPSGCVPSLLSTLAAFVSLVTNGETPAEIRPLFFGARLTAISKKEGGVCPIAVGCTLRCFVAKIASGIVLGDMSALLAPRKLGFGVKGGAESAVHAARWYLNNLHPGHAMLELDFCNAFNSIRCDQMLQSVLELCPTISPLVYSCYSAPSSLFWEGRVLESAEGVQQGTL